MADFSMQKYPFEQISRFSKFDQTYAANRSTLKAFYEWEPELDSFSKIKDRKAKHPIDRSLLVRKLKEQYNGLSGVKETTLNQIEKLANPTVYSVITAHQPSLATGPLYFVSKAASVIALAREINAKYSDFSVIPVFIIGGEDHDFDEVNHFHFQDKTVVWKQEQGGAVGRYKTKDLQSILKDFSKDLGTSNLGLDLKNKIIDPYSQHEFYGVATQQILHNLFGDEGLVVMQMDDPDFKAKMINVFRDDLTQHTSEKLVKQSQQELDKIGLKGQAMARSINLFYLEDNHRYRIDQEPSGQYYFVNTNRQFTQAEMIQMLEVNPGNFSPNVILRPLFQETILPNLAYIGGGGELAYWMERRIQFAHYDIPFPMLVRRDSSQWVNQQSLRQLQKWDQPLSLIWQNESKTRDELIKSYTGIDWNLDVDKNQIKTLFDEIDKKVSQTDPTLQPYVLGLAKKSENYIAHIEKKWARAIRRKEDDLVRQTDHFYADIYPHGKLQERYINYMDLCLGLGKELIPTMIENFSPLDMEMKVFYSEK